MILQEEFKLQMKNILGQEYSDFIEALHREPMVSIRTNPAKPENQLELFKPVPWCPTGHYLKERPVFTIDPFFHAGHYYVQEASSMFLDYVLNSIEIPLNPKILDLCSAPGGKSSLILSYLNNKGSLHCHEFDPYRQGVLKQNIGRWGYPNAIITYGSLQQLQKLDIRYDIILIDAPCSGEGMFRKEQEAWKQWNPNKVNHCSNIQKSIMAIADNLCTHNGYIIYSSCTWNTSENEEILQEYVKSENYRSVQIENNYPIHESFNSTYTYRFFPHKIEGEGFTISVIQRMRETTTSSTTHKTNIHFKTESTIEFNDLINEPDRFTSIYFKDNSIAVESELMSHFKSIFERVNTSYFGIPIGMKKGNDFYPAHALSQSMFLHTQIERLDLNRQLSLDYLRALIPNISIKSNSKWLIASYQSANLGWLKTGGQGLKNYLPKNQRIISF